MSELREALDRAVEQIADYRDGLPRSRVTPTTGRADVRRALGELRDGPARIAEVIDELVAAAPPGLMASAGPRYYGFVIGGSLDAAPEANLGWLAALRDRQVGRTLALIHRRPEHDWSVIELAREAGMSRSAFAARFTELVGQPAAQYLAQWRLHLARAQLLESRDSVAVVARRAGYQSEAAFGRAFKQFFGMPPGGLRKLAA